MENLREKLLNDKESLRKSVKENFSLEVSELFNIVADLIDYSLNNNTLKNELENLQCKNEINKSLKSEKTYSVNEVFEMKNEIKDINDININTDEGKLLISAISILTTVKEYSDKTPDEVIEELWKYNNGVYNDE